MTLDKAMQQARASLEIDGFIVKPEHERLIFSLLSGAIDEEEFDKQIQALLSLEGTS